MTSPVVSVDYTDTVVDAIDEMVRNKVKKIVVLKDNKLIGILSAFDIVNHSKPVDVKALHHLEKILPPYLNLHT
jgi:signal-transduction protein with cAMP-binding, CBS, and nucleotidyltransferase domain